MLVRLSQSLKALSPIEVTELPMVTRKSSLQSVKASFLIEVTRIPLIEFGTSRN